MESSLKSPNNMSSLAEIEQARSMKLTSTRSIPRESSLGRLPEVVLLGSFGLLTVAMAFLNGLAGTIWAELLYWLGLLLIILPIAFRLFSVKISRTERIGLIVFIGLSLYLVKMMHSPFMFTYSDELLHLRNAESILQSRALFGANTILPVSAYYPGLEILTTTIASLSGLNLFISGALVIGVARLVILLSMFLLFEQVSHSSRAAGLAVLIYMANSNFLYWSAQFSYESLSLPLAVMVLYALAKQGNTTDRNMRIGLSLLILLLIAAIIVTHHITSYALVIFLLTLSLVHSLTQFIYNRKQPNTWWFALVTGGLTLAWLFLAAKPTIPYLNQIFSQAFASMFRLVTRGEAGRILFTSSTGTIAPLWERLLGISSVLLVTFGILLGLYFLLKRIKLNPFAMVLSVTALIYFLTLGLRLTGGGWEVANRSSEFLFVGIAFLIASAFATLRLIYPRVRLLSLIFAGYSAILIMGGVIAGWPPTLRLSQPLLFSVGNTAIHSQGLEASEWMLSTHGPDNQVIAPTSDALLMLAYGGQQAMTGKIHSIHELLTTQHTLDWQTDILKKVQARFLVMDRRQISWDGMLGEYFTSTVIGPTNGTGLLPDTVFMMFDGQTQIPRIFDSGDLVIYDVGGLSDVPPSK